MGFMDSLKSGIKKVSDEAKAKAEREKAEKEELERRMLENEREMALYYASRDDKKYQALRDTWIESHSKIEESYSVINSLNAFGEAAGDKFLEQCEKHIVLSQIIEPYWEKYEVDISWGGIYKRIAMAYEKRGDYFNSAQACVCAINEGFTDDGTTGGYRGRLARMIKKGKLEPTEEMQKVLLEIFE